MHSLFFLGILAVKKVTLKKGKEDTPELSMKMAGSQTDSHAVKGNISLYNTTTGYKQKKLTHFCYTIITTTGGTGVVVEHLKEFVC